LRPINKKEQVLPSPPSPMVGGKDSLPEFLKPKVEEPELAPVI